MIKEKNVLETIESNTNYATIIANFCVSVLPVLFTSLFLRRLKNILPRDLVYAIYHHLINFFCFFSNYW